MERGRIVISGDSPILAQDEHVFAIVRGTEEVPGPDELRRADCLRQRVDQPDLA
jgi:hypothetical protein